MPHHIYNQITEGLPACGEVFGDFYTVVPTYKILRAVLCLYDLPCPGCKMKDTMERAKLKSELDNLQRLVDRIPPDILAELKRQHGEGFLFFLSGVQWVNAVKGGFNGSGLFGEGNRLFEKPGGRVGGGTHGRENAPPAFDLCSADKGQPFPFSLAFALASSFSFSANRSLIVTLYFFSCPEKFSICGNRCAIRLL